MTRPVLVIGETGQVARALKALLGNKAVYLSRDVLNLGDPDSLISVLSRYEPSAVINAAAYTAVDKAESEPEEAWRVNGESPSRIAAWCKGRDIPFIHYSTDYVFNGEGETPWNEDAPPAPLGAYGSSKLSGEEGIQKAGGKYLILRTSWVYDADGKNFVNTMLKFGAEREEMKVVADQFGAPSYAPHLAKATMQVLDAAQKLPEFPSGIYHFCNAGVTSWHGFASKIFEKAKTLGLPVKVKTLHGISTAEYPTPAKRPGNSRMDCGKLKTVLNVALPDWEQGLDECMEIKRESARLSA